MGADLRPTLDEAGPGQVLNTYDWWMEHNGDALDAAMRMQGES